MIVVYPLAGRPVITVSVQCLRSLRRFYCPMLVDTGADTTCFPAAMAGLFGHDNNHADVQRGRCRGIGGVCRTYLHSVQISLIQPGATQLRLVWTSPIPKAEFIENMEADCGLLGMDVIRQWRRFSIVNHRGRQRVEIEI